MDKGKRHLYMDVLRIAACLCVIYNHTEEYGFFMFATREPGSMQYFVEMYASILCKMAVPVFFALSGALMLGREISLKTLWKKKIPRIALALLLFCAVYYGAEIAADGTQPDIKRFIFGVYESGWGYSLWYLYAYLAFLVVLPALSAMAKALDKQAYVYMFAVALVFRCLIPGFEAYHWEGVHKLNPDFDLAFLTCDIVLYPLMGYFIHHRMDQRDLRRATPALCVSGAVLTAVSCAMTYRDYGRTWVVYTQTYHNLFAPVLCAAAFCLVKVLFDGMDARCRLARALAWVGGCTFGIYLVHPLFVDHLSGLGGLFDWMLQTTGVLPLLGSFLYALLMMIISMALVCLLRRIPLLGKLIS